MKKILLLLVMFSALFCNGICGTFTKITSHKYLYAGIVEPLDLNSLIKLHELNKRKLEITITSPGGVYQTGLDLGLYTKANGIRIIVDKAFSAAGLWALGDRHVKFLSTDSIILLHLPYIMSEDYSTNQPELWMNEGYELGLYFTDIVGWNKSKTRAVLTKLTELREEYGIHSGIAIKGNNKMYIVTPVLTPATPVTPPVSQSFLLLWNCILTNRYDNVQRGSVRGQLV
ncbi:MAG TPA: hypothetical protein VKR58_06335 [Aquella sp.]|nr:hypothetical protein [Aquella sp.]